MSSVTSKITECKKHDVTRYACDYNESFHGKFTLREKGGSDELINSLATEE